MATRYFSYVLGLQGLYYFSTGLWPIFGLGSFLTMTGPKTDLWLVRTVGCLIAVAGAAMMTAAVRRRISPEILILALGSASVLLVIDLVYVISQVIPPIYLADGAVELAAIGFWYYGYRLSGGMRRSPEADIDAEARGEPMVH